MKKGLEMLRVTNNTHPKQHRYPQLALALHNKADASVSAGLSLVAATALLHSLALDAAGLARRDVAPAALRAAQLGGIVAHHEAVITEQGDDAGRAVVDRIPTTGVCVCWDAVVMHLCINPMG